MDKYEIITKIGEGSFGKIFLAKEKVDNEQCVIKEINLSKVNQQNLDDNSSYLPDRANCVLLGYELGLCFTSFVGLSIYRQS